MEWVYQPKHWKMLHACCPPFLAPTNAHCSYLQHHLLLQHQAALDQKVEQREIRVCH